MSQSDLTSCADNLFDEGGVNSAQEHILCCLGWKLYIPTMFDFYEALLEKLDNPSEKTKCVIRHVLDHALQSQCYLKYRPSIITASVFAIAFHCLGQPTWPEKIQKATNYSVDDLQPCVSDLCQDVEHILATMPNLKIVERKSRMARFKHGIVGYQIPRVLILETQQ